MIRFNKPTLKRADMDGVLQTLVDEHIGPGEKSRQFVRSFCEETLCNEARAFRTYPDCIRTAFKILDVNSDTNVAVSPLAPSVYLDVLKEFGCSVSFVDVYKENGMPDVSSVEKSSASVLVLYESCGSLPVKYNEETTYFDKIEYSTVKVIEDISQSIGSRHQDDLRAGSWGDIVISSLEEDDVISAGGGAVLGVKSELSLILSEFGISSLTVMPDINAALGIVQLEKLAEYSLKRREICDFYSFAMKDSKHKKFGLTNLDYVGNGANYSIFLDCKPDSLIEFAKRHDIPVKRTFANSICSTYSGDMYEIFPNAASFFSRTVSFPVYPFLTEQEIKSISRIVANLP